LLYRYLLFIRFTLVNLVAAALLAAAYLQGWLDGVFEAYLWELSLFIFAVFAYGLVMCGAKVWRRSVELNDLMAGTPPPESRAGRFMKETENASPESRTIQADAFRLKITDGIVDVRHIANALVLLGLIGTVIGFIIALSGVDPDTAKNADSVATMVATLINGMSVALYTTLVGGVLHIWLIINYRILTSGTVDLIAAIVQLSESRARN
jgi:hypothetical protein